jgi:energy-coupling factor transporter ATP-binding protein EcfA2
MLSTFIVTLLIGLTTPNAQPVLAEELYQVLFVDGLIKNKTTGAMLQRGDKLKASDKVVFQSKGAKAVVLSNVKGRFVMAANPTTSGGSELAQVVGSIVSPLKTNAKLSTRGGETEDEKEKGVKDFKVHFGKKEDGVTPIFVVLGNEYGFKVNKGVLQMKDEDGIALSYATENGSKGIKSLGEKEGGKLIINKETFAGKFELSQLTNFEFYRFNKTTKQKGDLLASFRPKFVNVDEVKAAFKDYLSLTTVDESLKEYMAGNKEALSKLSTMNEEDKKVELLFYFLNEMYGTPTESGEINVNALKVDYDALHKFIKENKI